MGMRHNKIAVIIPVFNVEEYVAECLESTICQTLKEIEIICVNDGSTDGSLSILEQYAAKDNRIKIISQDNAGVSAARNTGIKYASAKYLYFLDSDDKISPDTLELAYDRMEQFGLDFLCFDGTAFSDGMEFSEEALKFTNYYQRSHSYNGEYSGQKLLTDMLANEEYRVNAALSMARYEFFVEHNLWFLPGILHEDNAYTFCALLEAKKAGYLNYICYQRRVRNNSIMTSPQSYARATGYFDCYLYMKERMKKVKVIQEAEVSVNEILYRVIHNARKIFSALEENERSKYLEMGPEKRALFRLLVVDDALNRDERNRIKFQLQKAYNEKSEINGKLQGAYQEKSELNAKLQKTYEEKSELNAKLQKAYQEKSEMNEKLHQAYKEKSEINRKLQITYREKAERGIQIKELQKKNIDYKTKIKTLLESKDYRLGNGLLKLPRKCNKIFQSIINAAKLNKSKKKKKDFTGDLWLIGTPEFGNLGDHQISESEIEFLRDLFPKRILHEVTMTEYYKQKEMLEEKIKKSDILFFHGGGNIGNYWPKSEYIRRDAFHTWPDNYKIVMPQSIYFTQNDEGKSELELSRSIYTGPKVIVACRDKVSYEFAKKNFSCKILLTPDMVMYSSKMDYAGCGQRKGALLCLRKDKEKWLSKEDENFVTKTIERRYALVKERDTVIQDFRIAERKQYLEDMFTDISSAELVVTDRLHGMVFCAITGTPCVVFPNDHHKIREAAKWFGGIDYICYIDRVDVLDDAIDKVVSCKERVYPRTDLQNKFRDFQNEITGLGI